MRKEYVPRTVLMHQLRGFFDDLLKQAQLPSDLQAEAGRLADLLALAKAQPPQQRLPIGRPRKVPLRSMILLARPLPRLSAKAQQLYDEDSQTQEPLTTARHEGRAHDPAPFSIPGAEWLSALFDLTPEQARRCLMPCLWRKRGLRFKAGALTYDSVYVVDVVPVSSSEFAYSQSRFMAERLRPLVLWLSSQVKGHRPELDPAVLARLAHLQAIGHLDLATRTAPSPLIGSTAAQAVA